MTNKPGFASVATYGTRRRSVQRQTNVCNSCNLFIATCSSCAICCCGDTLPLQFLAAWLPVHQPGHLPIYLHVRLSVSPSVIFAYLCLSDHLSIRLLGNLSVCLRFFCLLVYLSVCPSILS